MNVWLCPPLQQHPGAVKRPNVDESQKMRCTVMGLSLCGWAVTALGHPSPVVSGIQELILVASCLHPCTGKIRPQVQELQSAFSEACSPKSGSRKPRTARVAGGLGLSWSFVAGSFASLCSFLLPSACIPPVISVPCATHGGCPLKTTFSLEVEVSRDCGWFHTPCLQCLGESLVVSLWLKDLSPLVGGSGGRVCGILCHK